LRPILIVLSTALALLCGACSGNNIGRLFDQGFVKGDPAEAGFGTPDANGAYDLFGLEAGSLYVDGGPAVEAVYPVDGSGSVDVGAIVVLRFSESLSASETTLAASVSVKKKDGSGTVTGDLFFVDGTARRYVAFVPDNFLEDETEYVVDVAVTLIDAQGEPFGPPGAVTTFTTGKAGDDVPFEVISSLTLPADSATGVSDRASVLVFFTEGIDTTTATAGFSIEDQSNVAVAGNLSFPAEFFDRLLLFTPAADMPSGKRIDVSLARTIKNFDQSEELDSQVDFSFTVIGIPHVTAIDITAGDPLVALPASVYAGTVTAANQNAVKVDITLTGSGSADRLVLIFWDNRSKAIVVVDEARRQAGTVSYTVDLKPMVTGGDAIADGTISVGAFTSDAGGNSPVGPPSVLPALRKDLVEPGLDSLGPPYGSGVGKSELLLEMPRAGIHGRADEALRSVKVTVDVDGTPQELEGIVFFSMEYPSGSGIYSQEVTRGGSDLFITESLTGIDVDTVGRAAPFTVTEIVLTDLVGNTTTLTSPADTSVDFRGYVDQLPATATGLEVFCHDSVTLLPITGADVLVDQHSSDYSQHSADRLGGQTGTDGTITFSNVSVLLPQARITVTAIKDGYEFTSILGLDKPAAGSGVSISLPLVPESGATSAVTTFFSDATGNPLPNVYIGGNRIATGTDEVLYDAGVDPVSITNPPVVTAARGELQFFQAMGVQASTPEDLYQWAWANPFVGETGAAMLVVLFSDTLKDVSQLTVQSLETENLLSAYSSDIEARLVARLDGITGTLPLAVDRNGISIGGGEYSFEQPMPPSLFVNEMITAGIEGAAFDPPFELVLEPALGPGDYVAAPDQSLLEAALFFEVEEVDAATDPKIIRKRIPYTQAGVGTVRKVTFPEQGGTPIEMFALFLPTVNHPLHANWSAALALANSSGVYVLHYAPDGGARHWRTLVPSAAYSSQSQVVYFPDLDQSSLPAGFTAANDFSEFRAAGNFTLRAEAFELSGFDLNESFLSTIDRDWVTYWRSDLVTGSLQ
jgi:hypothetical protein